MYSVKRIIIGNLKLTILDLKEQMIFSNIGDLQEKNIMLFIRKGIDGSLLEIIRIIKSS